MSTSEVSKQESDGPKVKAQHRHFLQPYFDGERFTGPLAALICAVGAGQLYMLAFPPHDLWFLLPLALGFILFSSFTRHWAVSFLAGAVSGASAFIPLFSWANIYAGAEPWIALAVFEALFFGVFSVAARLIYVRHGLCFSSSVGVALVWATVELARSTMPWGGLPWGVSAFAYADSPLLNFGPWVGTVGLGFITGLLGTYCFTVFMALLCRRRSGYNGINAVWPSAAIVIILLIALVMPRPPATTPAERQRITVAAVQGNVKPPPAGSYYLPKEMFDNHAAATRAYLDTSPTVDLIVWPEDSTGWDLPSDAARMSAVMRLSSQAQAPLLVGSQVPHGAHERLNKAILIDDKGATGKEYAKQHPVPFGEYIPARGFFSMLSDKTDLVKIDMAAGPKPGVLPISGTKVGTLICFEIAYEENVRDTVTNGAEMLIVQSNNALFGNSHEAIQQLAQARVFSVISGRSVVHVSTVGHSAVYTPDGQVLTSLDHWEQGTMTAIIPLRSSLTPAMKYGSMIASITVVLALVYLARALLTRPRIEERRR